MGVWETKEGYWESPEGDKRLEGAYTELIEIMDYLVRHEWEGVQVTVGDPDRWVANLFSQDIGMGLREFSVTKVGERTFRVVKRREVPPWGDTTERIVAPMLVEEWYAIDCHRDDELAAASFWFVREALDPEDPETWKRLKMLNLLHRALKGEQRTKRPDSR